MKVLSLVSLLLYSSLSIADMFAENAELICNEHLVKVSTFCGCSSDLSEEAQNASQKDCSVRINVFKENKEITTKSIIVKGCYEAYEFGETYLCVEKAYTAMDVSFFTDSLTEYPWRKKCVPKK
jgi:hypothetical protein